MDYFEYIDGYMDGTLDDRLRQEFEKEIKTNAELAAAVKNYSVSQKIAEGLLEIDMQETLDRLQQDTHKPSRSSRVINMSPWIGVAASMLFLIAALWWWTTVDQTISAEAWQSQYTKLYDLDATKSELIADDPLSKAKYLYNLNRHEESVDALKAIINTSQNQDTLDVAWLYLGDTYLILTYLSQSNDWSQVRDALKQSRDPRAQERLDLLEELTSK